jgi:putative selenate reductase
VAELIPAPFANLLRRMLREFEAEGKVFDLPARKFWHGSPDLDTSATFHGRRAASPLGPAAGPHGQMAQNIVLAWLAGSRILELKTVQQNDRLTIPRPCIDAQSVCYNVEWSQELRLAESLREYVKGSMLLDILREINLLGRPGDPDKDQTLFDMSVGYDLAGIGSPAVRSWIGSMKDASAIVEQLRQEIPDDLRRFRDLDFTTSLSDQITLSTFHGCPASEIEGIARFLMTEMGIQVTVKLNPTLLGRETVEGLLHDLLGYNEIETRPEDFEKDLQWAQALEIVDRLTELGHSLGRGCGVKLSNTLVVRNHRSVFPASEGVMYLSGQPLHVLTLNLLGRFRQVRPEVPISFSAGVDNRNFADCVALGLVPVTTCTDLLRPGGYGRLPKYLENLEQRMRSLSVRNLGDYVVKACGRGEQAIRSVAPPGSLQAALLASLGSDRVDLRSPLAEAGQEDLYQRLVQQAAVLNTPLVVEKATADPRYRAEQNRAVPRRIGSRLWLFDCINCDKCVPDCPNDANFVYETGPLALDYRNYRVGGGKVEEVEGGRFEVGKVHQIANFQDFCNECGNCDTFCPEDGGPYLEKPRFFGSLDAWKEIAQRDGFYCRRQDDVDAVWGRIGGREYHLEVDRARDRGLFTDGVVKLELRHSERRVLLATARAGAADGHSLDFAAYLNLALVVDGVLDRRKANPVNVGTP